MPIKGRPRIHTRKYKDEFSHIRYTAYLRHKSQCVYRHRVGLEVSGWDLTVEDWFAFWATPELWAKRGRQRDCLVLTRIDETKPWSKKNCRIQTRLETIQRTNAKQIGVKRGSYGPRKKK